MPARFEELDSNGRIALIQEIPKLTEQDAVVLENLLLEKPNDLIARAKLLGYYRRCGSDCVSDDERFLNHVLWMIDNVPDQSGFFRLFNMISAPNEELKTILKERWLKQCELNKDSSAVHVNAGFYISWFDFELGQQLLEQAEKIDPNNSVAPHFLGQFCLAVLISTHPEAKETYARRVIKHATRLSELDGGPHPKVVLTMWLPPCQAVLGDTMGDTTWIKRLEEKIPPSQ